MQASDKIFIFGKQPREDANMMLRIPHPINEKILVRFVKHPTSGKLYFNFKDFLEPYKNPFYKKVILNLVPKKFRKLDRIWMSCEAWTEIKVGIDQGKEKDIITGWKERLLF
jgi:hypothetical protein